MTLTRENELIEAFETFHADNPHVYDELRELVQIIVARNIRRISIRMLWEVMRWNFLVQTITDDGYKLNDHHCAFYARMLMERGDAPAGMFSLRGSAADAR